MLKKSGSTIIIGGYSKALAENMAADELQRKRYLDTIYDKSIRVSNLIDNLFELAKLENVGVSENRIKTDAAEFLRGIAAEHFEQIEEKGMLLVLKLPEEAVEYTMDKKEMSRVISNLLENAIQYNSPGTEIKIELAAQEDVVVIKIADNGIGISENLKESIFDPFVRGDASRGSSGGTGLGLAIAGKIVENHGGSLILQFDEKYKTIFRISLPL